MQKERGCIVQEPLKNRFPECAVSYSASREAQTRFERDCEHLDIYDESGIVTDVLAATADPR
jgi:hypothetical protein